MTYAVQQDLIDRFGEEELIQLTDRADPPLGSIDSTVVSRALEDADAEINSYLQSRYSLPLASVPKILVLKACNIARYYLYEDSAPEHIESRYKSAVAWLKDVSAGKVSLGLDTLGSEVQDEGIPQATTPDRIFSRDKMKDF